jgi:hypothetical protein
MSFSGSKGSDVPAQLFAGSANRVALHRDQKDGAHALSYTNISLGDRASKKRMLTRMRPFRPGSHPMIAKTLSYSHDAER